jgi:hypothetical protein
LGIESIKRPRKNIHLNLLVPVWACCDCARKGAIINGSEHGAKVALNRNTVNPTTMLLLRRMLHIAEITQSSKPMRLVAMLPVRWPVSVMMPASSHRTTSTTLAKTTSLLRSY